MLTEWRNPRRVQSKHWGGWISCFSGNPPTYDPRWMIGKPTNGSWGMATLAGDGRYCQLQQILTISFSQNPYQVLASWNYLRYHFPLKFPPLNSDMSLDVSVKLSNLFGNDEENPYNMLNINSNFYDTANFVNKFCNTVAANLCF
jgi:hypothetical protein